MPTCQATVHKEQYLTRGFESKTNISMISQRFQLLVTLLV